MDLIRPETKTKCPHCQAETETGTHNGCYGCGRVKTTEDGRKPKRREKEAR